jgi:hypothetical protein
VLRHVVRLAAVTFAVAAAGVVVPSRAEAATCGTASGVSVVVDFHQLQGGGAETACDAGGAGENAAAQFTDVGHTLTYVQDEAFVCQVDGRGSPQCARTPPANAYWSLWWSDGKSGTWKYAASGVTSLKVPEGGYVALSWQKGNAEVPPRVKPSAHGSSPTSPPTSAPTSHPTQTPTHGPTQSPTTGPTSGATASGQVTPTGTPSSRGTPKTHPSKGSKQTEPHHHHSKASDQAGGALPDVSSGDGGSGSGSGGLPGWLAPVAVVLLFAVGGTVALLRRKSSGGT